MGIHEWSYDNEIAQRLSATRCRSRDKAIALQGHQGRGRAGLRPAARARRGRALPQLRRADRVHRRRCASSATPASTSARWTASPSPSTARKPSCARASMRRRPTRRRTFTFRTGSRPAASWSRTRTCACTAGCAPSAARPAPGTCRNSCCEMTPAGVRHAGKPHTPKWQRHASTTSSSRFANVNGSGSA